MHVSVCAHVCMIEYMCVCMRSHVCAYAREWMCSHMCMYVCVCAHMYAGDRELWVCVFAVNTIDITEYQQISVV